MTERRLLAFLAGALEPGEEADLSARVRDDPELARLLDTLRERMEEGPPRERWSVPPPGVWGGQRPFAVSMQQSALSAEPVRPGDAFALKLADPGPPERLVVLLLRGPGGWEVLSPASEDERVLLSDLPREPGGYRLDLIADDRPGRQRWAVALPEADLPIDWSLPPVERWAALQEAVAEGRVAVSSFEVG